jgi:glycine cleavage system aminomethyltransferase T
VHSFALGQNIAIAVVDAAVEIGDTVTIRHQAGTSQAKVTTLPFV